VITINKIVLATVVEQVFNPFRIFQAFSEIVWSFGDCYLLCRLQWQLSLLFCRHKS